MSNIIQAVKDVTADSFANAGRDARQDVMDEIAAATNRTGHEIVIVSRHPGAVEWLADQGYVGTVIDHATPEDVAGKVVIGNLPLHLAALAHQVGNIDLPNLSRGQRGGELGKRDMVAAGAVIRWYAVESL